MLKPAHVYKIDFLVQKACAILLQRYPAQLPDFDREWRDREDQLYVPVINLAMGLPQLAPVLPALFYLCCQTSSVSILRPYRFPDLSTERLCDANIVRCMLGRERLMRANTHFLEFLIGTDKNRSTECKDKRCIAGLTELSSAAVAKDRFCTFAALADPLPWVNAVLSEVKISGARDALCAKCVDHVHTLMTSHRQGIWDGLSQVFDLDTFAPEEKDCA